MNREISPMMVAGIVAGIVAVGLVIFLIRGPLAPRLSLVTRSAVTVDSLRWIAPI